MNAHISVPEAWLDTRHAGRHTLYRPILIQTDGSAALCLLRDLSPNGLRVKAYRHFASGEKVLVHFSTDLIVMGAVAWCHDDQAGIEFDQPVSVPMVFSQFTDGRKTKKGHRSPRLPIECSANLTVRGRTALVRLEDISQKGVRVRSSYLQPGDEVHLLLDGLDRRLAMVRWVGPEVAGLDFIRPLAFDELARWTAQQRATLRFGLGHSTPRAGGH